MNESTEFTKESHKPKQLLHWCFEKENFDEVIIIGITNGKARYHTSTADFNFLSLCYFTCLNLIQSGISSSKIKR